MMETKELFKERGEVKIVSGRCIEIAKRLNFPETEEMPMMCRRGKW